MKSHYWCEIGNHPCKPNETSVYWHEAVGIEKMVVCNRCLTLHIFEYWPNGKFVDYCRNHATDAELISSFGITRDEIPQDQIQPSLFEMVNA